MKNLWTDLCDFFFPRLCLGCGKKLLAGERALCMQCMSELPRTHSLDMPGNEMECCLWSSPLVCRASSLFYYTKGGMVSKILQGMKYQGRKELCRQMGHLLASELADSGFFTGIDAIVPVPLHPLRLKRRGYNQSEWLSKGIADLTGIPVVTDALIRTHNNATQTHKSGSERWQNARHLFRVTPDSNHLIHKHILLVDDVFTTGATTASCIDSLSSIEGVKISVVTLAYAK